MPDEIVEWVNTLGHQQQTGLGLMFEDNAEVQDPRAWTWDGNELEPMEQVESEKPEEPNEENVAAAPGGEGVDEPNMID